MKIIAYFAIAIASCSVLAQVTRSSSPAAAIPDSTCSGTDGSGGISDTIAYPETGTISDVDVRVAFDHTWRGDLQFHVAYSGGGGNVVLAADHGGFNADNYYATFDDAAGVPCSTVCSTSGACSSLLGSVTCSPNSALSAFNTLASPGTWTFAVCDDAGGDTGTLQTWEITVAGSGGLPVELVGISIE